MEQDDFVDAVDEFGPEMAAHRVHHLRFHRAGFFTLLLRHQIFGTQIGGHDDQHIAEIDRAALPVGEAAIVEHLQQHIEDIRVGFLDLVEQHHLIGPPPHRFGQRAAFVIADIAGRCADQAGDRVLFHIFGHVDAHHGAVVVKHELRQGFGQLGFANAGGSKEHERTHRAVGVLQARAGAAHGGRDGMHRLLLANDALADFRFHFQQLVALALQHPVHRHAGPARDDLRDMVGGDGLIDQHVRFAALGFRQLLFQRRNGGIG